MIEYSIFLTSVLKTDGVDVGTHFGRPENSLSGSLKDHHRHPCRGIATRPIAAEYRANATTDHPVDNLATLISGGSRP